MRPFLGETAGRLDRRHPARHPDIRLRSAARRAEPACAQLVLHCLEKDPAATTAVGARPGPRRAGRDRALDPFGGRDAGPTSIAVLPFADMSPEKDQDYFCEGIAEELIGSLAQVARACSVASRTSSFQLQELRTSTSARSAASSASSTLLEGSVRKAGDRLRIPLELVDVPGRAIPLWSERYDRELQDVFAIQEEIARSIVRALQLDAHARRAALLQAAAHQRRRGLRLLPARPQVLLRVRRKGIELALQMFSAGHRARPATHVARLRRHRRLLRATSSCTRTAAPGACGEADAASRQGARAGSRRSAEAHASRGLVLSLRRRARARPSASSRPRSGSNPELFEAYYLYARDCFAQGQLEKAVQLYEKASAVRPEDYQSPLLVAQIYVDLGWPADADAARRRGVRHRRGACSRTTPTTSRALYMGANGLVALGERERGARVGGAGAGDRPRAIRWCSTTWPASTRSPGRIEAGARLPREGGRGRPAPEGLVRPRQQPRPAARPAALPGADAAARRDIVKGPDPWGDRGPERSQRSTPSADDYGFTLSADRLATLSAARDPEAAASDGCRSALTRASATRAKGWLGCSSSARA